MTRAQMERAAENLADTLHECGVREGQPVAHIVESGPTALSVMFGCWLVGAVYVPINGRITEAEISGRDNLETIALCESVLVAARDHRVTTVREFLV